MWKNYRTHGPGQHSHSTHCRSLCVPYVHVLHSLWCVTHTLVEDDEAEWHIYGHGLVYECVHCVYIYIYIYIYIKK